jgi:hypothetical protein
VSVMLWGLLSVLIMPRYGFGADRAACSYSLKHGRVPWPCYRLQNKALELQELGFTIDDLDAQCVRAAGEPNNMTIALRQNLSHLPKPCAQTALRSAAILQYKKGDF